MEIKVRDIVLHTLSGLYFKCENTKQAVWMNINKVYVLVKDPPIPDNYFYKDK